jgi:hypothetical protein
MNPSANHTATPAGIIGMPGWFASEQVAGFDRNRWLVSSEYAEQPIYTQFAFAIDRLRDLSKRDPALAERDPFKAALAGDLGAVLAGGEKGLAEVIAVTRACMS